MQKECNDYTGIILCMHPANERTCYTATSSPICWAHTQNDPQIISIAFSPIYHNHRLTWPSGIPKKHYWKYRNKTVYPSHQEYVDGLQVQRWTPLQMQSSYVCFALTHQISMTNKRNLRHADIRSHPGHYPVDPYTSPWSPKGLSHVMNHYNSHPF